MQETNRTEISTLGEFGLIKHLTENIRLINSSTRYGVGDDCAVMEYPADKQVLVTSDLLMEGIHFDLTYVPMKHLGYKAAMVNLSDIYAMNGIPPSNGGLHCFRQTFLCRGHGGFLRWSQNGMRSS